MFQPIVIRICQTGSFRDEFRDARDVKLHPNMSQKDKELLTAAPIA